MAAVAALGIGLARDAAAQKPVPYPDALERMNQAIDALTAKVWPSVVQIVVTSYGAKEEARAGESTEVVFGHQRSVGSGFVVDPDGYIMTNAHVVANAQRVQVLLPPAKVDGSLQTALSPKMNVVPARIVGLTREIDLALLKVDDVKLPGLTLATYSQVRQGETVFAFGSPSGLRNSLTHGLVSAVARQTHPDSPLIYIQTDAPINPGNSGGPLVNIRGEVVGMNTFILSTTGGSDGLGFAIPSATIRTAFRQLKEFGQLRRQEVGMSLQTITPEMVAGLGLARESGVIVSDVWPRGPAEAAGLQPGDILVSVDGQPAENLPTVNYNFRLRDSPNNVELVVLRGVELVKLSVKALEQMSQFDAITSMADPARNLVPELGIIGVEIDPRVIGLAAGLRDPYGIIVAARAAGARTEVPVQPSDVIRSVNNVKVTSLAQLRSAVRELKPGTAVTMHVQRDGRLIFVSFTVE
jgi:serine protease Do